MGEDLIDQLFAAAAQVRKSAHAPYSRFQVGAALSCEGGSIFTGCNVENAAYPSGTCAEESAIAAMVAAGHRQISTIVILGDAPTPLTPCGACRQRIREFAHGSTRIIAGNLAGARCDYSIDDLLPHAFSLRGDQA